MHIPSAYISTLLMISDYCCNANMLYNVLRYMKSLTFAIWTCNLSHLVDHSFIVSVKYLKVLQNVISRSYLNFMSSICSLSA